MKAYKTHHKYPTNKISDTFANSAPSCAPLSSDSPTQPETNFVTDYEPEAREEIYSPPVAKVAKPYSAKALNNKRKAQKLAEARLAHISEELSELANSLRYFNPLLAEALDEAWDATEAAIEMLGDDRGW